MAAPKRFFVDRICKEVLLSGDEFRHAKNVLRLCEGDEVTLLDGSGKEYSAVIAKVEKSQMILHTVREQMGEREPTSNVCLLVGALKGDKTELVVQKAVELGVNQVIVFSSRYCSAYMNDNKIERLNRVAKEAAKQCLRSRVPQVVYCDSLKEGLEQVKEYDNKLFACEFLQKSERAQEKLVGSCALVVGSEGGFSEEEFEEAKTIGFEGVSLGKRILRAETAAISFLAVVMYRLGEWQ